MKAKQITVREFVEKLNEHAGKNNFAFFLGAGASRSAGIPIASEMINEWILKVARRQKITGITDPYEDASKQKLKKEILYWAEEYKTKVNSKASEYGFWFEQACPIRQERQDYIEDKISDAIDPTPEYYLFAQLIERNISNVILTVNFDDLVAESIRLCNTKKPLVIYDENFMWNARTRTIGKRPQILKIHGDFLFSTMKNSDKETAKLPQETTEKLEEFLHQLGLVVIGYGGNDNSVMTALETIAKKTSSFPYGIYWCTYGNSLPELAKKIEETETEFFHIPKADFLTIMLECQSQMNLDNIDKLSEKVEQRISKAKELLNTQATAIQDTVAKDSEDVEQLKKKAELAYFKDDYKTAIELFEQLDKLTPIDHNLYFRWGNALYDWAMSKKGEDTERLFGLACEKYEAALKIKPDDHKAHNNWGNALYNWAMSKTGEEAKRLFGLAGEKFEAALKIKPDLHEALYNWGNALSERAKNKTGKEADRLFESAGEKYEAALKIKPDLHEALYNWGIALSDWAKMKTGEEVDRLFVLAGEKYGVALKIKPDDHAALCYWGNALSDWAKMKTGEDAERLFALAGEKYEAALKIKPDLHEALNNWGVSLMDWAKSKTGKEAESIFELAEEKYKTALKLRPDYANCNYNIACLYSLQNNKTGAISYLHQAIKLDKQNKMDARTDKDFEPLWNDEEFIRITKE